MSISRSLSMLIAVVLVVTAILAIRGGMVTGAAVSSGQDLSDYFQRHADASVAANVDLSDYFLRHPASALPAGAASDWFERHAASLKLDTAVDRSDYFQRHPAPID
jgi:hypothetical protein